MLHTRFHLKYKLQDLYNAIAALTEQTAVSCTMHPSHTVELSNLGILLFERFWQSMAMGDCDKAIKICEKAVTDIHLQSFDQTSVLHNMSSVLHARFTKLKIQVSEKVKALPCSNITS